MTASVAPESCSYRLENSNITVLRVHSLRDCHWVKSNLPCPVHAPTDHPLRGWEQTWSQFMGFGRVCPEHGLVHPDPDDLGIVWTEGCCDCDEV